MTPTDAELEIRKFIKAERARVFEAWTTPALMQKWLAPGDMTVPSAEVDLRVGGRYRIEMRDQDGLHTTYGVYREIVPNEKLVFTWGWEGPNRHETLVTVTFVDKDGGTEVTLRHERFANAEQAKLHKEGWTACLDNLAAHLALD